MAIRPDYTIGTITLTSGSVNFTTSGSSLQIAGVQAGDSIITSSGDVLIIATVTGQNAGTLFQPCPASAAGSAQPLRIRFQPDGSRYQAAARDLIARWGQSGNVDAFAGLAGVVDGVPVFTGAGTMEIQGKDTFVTPDPNGNLAELAGLSNIDNLAELAAIAKDNNQFIIMGASGEITLRPMSDIDNAIASLQTGKFNNPTGSVGQFLRGNGTPQSVVGTVTQASGGAIIQRGSNANGEFIRYADGTQICWGVVEAIYSNGNSNTYRLGGEWNYPASFTTGSVETFLNPPVQQGGNWTGITGAQSGRGSARIAGTSSSSSGANFSIFFDAGTVSTTDGRVQNIGIHAIGRWF